MIIRDVAGWMEERRVRSEVILNIRWKCSRGRSILPYLGRHPPVKTCRCGFLCKTGERAALAGVNMRSQVFLHLLKNVDHHPLRPTNIRTLCLARIDQQVWIVLEACRKANLSKRRAVPGPRPCFNGLSALLVPDKHIPRTAIPHHPPPSGGLDELAKVALPQPAVHVTQHQSDGIRGVDGSCSRKRGFLSSRMAHTAMITGGQSCKCGDAATARSRFRRLCRPTLHTFDV